MDIFEVALRIFAIYGLIVAVALIMWHVLVTRKDPPDLG